MPITSKRSTASYKVKLLHDLDSRKLYGESTCLNKSTMTLLNNLENMVFLNRLPLATQLILSRFCACTSM